MDGYPLGAFRCEIVLQRHGRAPTFVPEDRNGVTVLVARDYDIMYEAVLRFGRGAELPITAQLVGEHNQQLVIRDGDGRPVRTSGYAQGSVEISTPRAGVIFRGRYYDSRTLQALAGDADFRPVGQRLVQHWENGFGEGPYAGHAFSVGVQLTRDGATAPLRGEASGQID